MSAVALALAPHHGRLGEAPAPGAPCPDETGTMVALAIGGALLGTIAGVAISSFWPSKREAAHHQEIARLQRIIDRKDMEMAAAMTMINRTLPGGVEEDQDFIDESFMRNPEDRILRDRMVDERLELELRLRSASGSEAKAIRERIAELNWSIDEIERKNRSIFEDSE